MIKIINEPTAASLAYGFGKCLKNNNNDLMGRNLLEENQSNDSNDNEMEEGNENVINEEETKKMLVFDLGGVP